MGIRDKGRGKDDRYEGIRRLFEYTKEQNRFRKPAFVEQGDDFKSVMSKQKRYSSAHVEDIIFDIEVTGINPNLYHNPSALSFHRDMSMLSEALARGEDPLLAYKKLEHFKYFEDVGLAQLSVLGGPFSRKGLANLALEGRKAPYSTGPWRQSTGKHNAAVIWTTDPNVTPNQLMDSLRGKPINIGFTQKHGILQQSLDALRRGEFLTEEDAVLGFVRALHEGTANNKILRLTGHNVWFDVMGMQSMAIRHAKTIQKHGLDPFIIANQFYTGNLVVESGENFFFDILRTKGLRDEEWGNKFLRFGKMAHKTFPEHPNVVPGAPVPLAAARRARWEYGSDLLRGIKGWKLEELEEVFLRYMNLMPEDIEGFLPHSEGKNLIKNITGLGAHNAMYDTAVSAALNHRFSRAKMFMDQYSKLHILEKAGKPNWEMIEAMAFGRSGFLGKDLMRTDLDDLGYAQWMAGDKSALEKATSRTREIWNSWESKVEGSLEAAAREGERVRSMRASRDGLVDTARRVTETKSGQPIFRSFDQTFNQAIGAFKARPFRTAGRIGIAVAASALLLRTAWPESVPNELESQLPSNQGKSRQPVSVPWASPWQGIDLDVSRARAMQEQQMEAARDRAQGFSGLVGSASNFMFGSVAPLALLYTGAKAVGYAKHFDYGRKALNKLYDFSRLFEEATPFRVGRIFNLSSNLASHVGADVIKTNFDYLVDRGRLSDIGAAYARGMDIDPGEFLDYINKAPDRELIFARSGSSGYHTVQFSKNVESGLAGLTKEVKLFPALSRRGRAAVNYGARYIGPDIDLKYRRLTMYQMGRTPGGAAMSDTYGTIRQKVHNFLGRLIGRHRTLHEFSLNRLAVPKWDSDLSSRWHARVAPAEEVWIPGFQSTFGGTLKHFQEGEFKAGARALHRRVGLTVFDWYKSVWGLARSQLATVGIDIGDARSLRQMGKTAVKVGGVLGLGIGAFTIANETFGGALTAPLWNIRDRIDIAHSWVSEKLGLTELRKRSPDIGHLSFLPWLTLPLVTGMTARYGHRVLREVRGQGFLAEAKRTGKLFPPGSEIEDFLSEPRLQTPKPGDYLDKLKLRSRGAYGIKKWTRGGKLGLLAWGAITALHLPFLGSEHTVQETKDILSGKEKVPIRRGRWWEFGNTPYEGGKIAYYRYHQSVRRRVDAKQEMPGEGGGLIGAIKTLFDPYWREKESYDIRPYPVTQPVGSEIPLIGPLIARTLGRFFKPPKLMHTEAWQRGDQYLPYGLDYEPRGEYGFPAPTPGLPTDIASTVRRLTYRATEFMGLRGFLFQSAVTGIPFQHRPTLESPTFRSFEESYYESELGGMLGLNELFRRFFPRSERGKSINPIPNQAPYWLPGEKYFIDFTKGDPYSKIPFGEERLPGPGYAAYNPELEGVRPEDYPAWARHDILADVAPWSQEYRAAKAAALSEAKSSAELMQRWATAEEMAENRRRGEEFERYSYLEDLQSIRGTVTRVLPGGKFQLSEYPHRTFSIAGANFSMNAVADHIREINKMTKEEATKAAFEHRKYAQQMMSDMMVGRQVKLKISEGALNTPDPSAEVFLGGNRLVEMLSEQGLAAPSEGRTRAGLLGRAYGGLMEGLAHIPQHVPGPFFLFSKLNNVASPIEEYRRSQLYGAEGRYWDKPWANFIRPYIYQTIGKLTPGEFVPPHIEEQRDVDMLYDRLEFLKKLQAGDVRGASRTMAGTDVMGASKIMEYSLPHRERDYFKSFLGETDPSKRKTILAMVSNDMRRALVGQWNRQYAESQGLSVSSADTSDRLAGAVVLAQREIQKSGYQIPGGDWVGWHPNVDLSDVKAVHIQQEGLDHHNFNIWSDQLSSLHRKPFIWGSHQALTSKPMIADASILSRAMHSATGQTITANEHLSSLFSGHYHSYHTIDWHDEELRQYINARERLMD